MCPCHIRGRIPEVWRAIYRLMEDDDRRVRFAAWHTLEDGGLPSEPGALARLELLLKQETDPKVRVFAKRLIGAALAERDRHEFMRMQLASQPASPSTPSPSACSKVAPAMCSAASWKNSCGKSRSR